MFRPACYRPTCIRARVARRDARRRRMRGEAEVRRPRGERRHRHEALEPARVLDPQLVAPQRVVHVQAIAGVLEHQRLGVMLRGRS